MFLKKNQLKKVFNSFRRGNMLFKKIILGTFFVLSGCGFTPLYYSNEGEVSQTEQVLVAPIADYNGYVLKQSIENALNPKGVNGPKKYILEVHLGSPLLSDQSIQGDNFASRKKITLTANYKLIDKNTKETVLSSSTTALGAFNVFYEPYTAYQAEKRQTEDLVQIVANNISLRVAAYLKQKEVESESETSSN